MTDFATPPKPVDVLGILHPESWRYIEGPNWRFVEQHREPVLSTATPSAEPAATPILLTTVVRDSYEALLRTRVAAGASPPRLAVIDAGELEAARTLVARMAATLARIGYAEVETGPPALDLLRSWRAEVREMAREALSWLPTERVLSEKIERGVQVLNAAGKAWGTTYADGQSTSYGWIEPADAPMHDARYVRAPMDVCPRTHYSDGVRLNVTPDQQRELESATVATVERRTTVSALR